MPRSVNITDELAKEMLEKDNPNAVSGINIEEAKLFLQNEREYDKQLDKARIKRMHAEKRFKEKEIRRAKRHKVIILYLWETLFINFEEIVYDFFFFKNNDGEVGVGQITLGGSDDNDFNEGNEGDEGGESFDEEMMHQEIDLNE